MRTHSISRIARRSAVVAGALISTVACSDEATAPVRDRAMPRSASAVDNPDLIKVLDLPPAPDGIISAGEYTDATSFSFPATVPVGFVTLPTTVTVYVKRLGGFLYFATVFDRKTAVNTKDHVAFEFDLDNDGDADDGDDVISASASQSPNVARLSGDSHRYNGGMYTRADHIDGGTTDNLWAWGTAGNVVVFENRHPLNSSDNAHDMSINTTTGSVTVGLRTLLRLYTSSTGSDMHVNSWKPSQTGYCQLTIGNKRIHVACPQ